MNPQYFNFAEQVIVSGGNFGLAILLSKALPAADFGVYGVVWVVIISISSLVHANFSSPMLSIAPSLSTADSQLFVIGLVKRMLWLMFFITVIWLLCYAIFFDETRLEVLFLGLACAPFLLFEFLRRVSAVRNEMGFLISIDLMLFGFIFAFLICFENVNFNIVSGVIAASYFMVSTLLLIRFLMNCGLNFSATLIVDDQSQLYMMRHKTFSLWASYTSVLQFVSGNGITLFSATILAMSDVGLLRLAQTFVSVFNPLLVFSDNHGRVYFSKKLATFGRSELDARFRNVGAKCLLVGFSIFVLMALVGDNVISFYYPEYADTNLYYFFLLYLVLTFLTFNTSLMRLWFLVLEDARSVFVTYVLAALVSVTVIFPLIYLYGAAGLVFSLIAAQIVMLMIFFAIGRRSADIQQS